MKSNKKISYDSKSFILNGQRKLLIGGEFHYFRTPPELWEDRLEKVKRSGANLITTYIPWNWHEQYEGKQKWTDDRDLKKFIELCIKKDLYLIVKPGPYCCAELDFGGHPDWLIGKDIKLRELDERYLDYVEKWYRKIAEIINPYLITNGGNIFSIQVENEYDHLITYGENEITLEDAVTYFKKLEQIMNDNGINIPKFANEAEFLRGKGIIDTRTYYPNIPFFRDWMWLLEHFDDKIRSAKSGQPDCPTMILELQIGWFGMFGRDQYIPELNLTEAVSKSVLMQGASVLNYYMYVGGTTFPFWGSRGDIVGVGLRENDHFVSSQWDGLYHYNLESIGMGMTSTFDFGGSPIHEWGELNPVRYYWLKGFNTFTQDFSELLLETQNTDIIDVVSGGDQINIINHKEIINDIKIKNHNTEKFTIITKSKDNQHLVCIRNMIDETRKVNIGYTKTNEIIFENLSINSYESMILPVNIRLFDTDISIVSSTSELLCLKDNELRIVGLYGKRNRVGNLILNVSKRDIDIIYGSIEVISIGKNTELKYIHYGFHILKIKDITLIIVEQDLAGKIEYFNNGILIADTYYIKTIKENENKLNLTAQIKKGQLSKFYYYGNQIIDSVSLKDKIVITKIHKVANLSEFMFEVKKDSKINIDWVGDWKVHGDIEESKMEYNDTSWQVLEKPISLEQAGLFEHGYVWYRSEFDCSDNLTNAGITFYGNNNDRQYIYINGHIVWGGISDKVDINIQNVIKPGKNIIAILYQNFYHNKSHPHEGDIIKYSGIMKPILFSGKTDGKEYSTKIEQFKVRSQLNGILNGYADSNFDDKCWMSVVPGDKYILGDNNGELLWMRRKFSIAVKPEIKYAVKLTIPKAENRCFIYVNGHPTGWYESVGPQHDFYIPESYLNEENVLTLLVDGHKGFITEPVLDTFYEAEEVEINIKLNTTDDVDYAE